MPNGSEHSHVPNDAPAPMSTECLGNDRVGHFCRYWLSLEQAAGGTPDRTQFDPAALIDLLPNIVLVEHLGGDEFRYRLIGTGVDWFTKRP